MTVAEYVIGITVGLILFGIAFVVIMLALTL